MQRKPLTPTLVEATGDYSVDCMTGRKLAENFIRNVSDADNAPALVRAIREAARSDCGSGVETGFLYAIALRAMAA